MGLLDTAASSQSRYALTLALSQREREQDLIEPLRAPSRRVAAPPRSWPQTTESISYTHNPGFWKDFAQTQAQARGMIV